MADPRFRPIGYPDLPGWGGDDPSAAFEAFRRSAFHVLEKPYRAGALGLECADFDVAFAQARRYERLAASEARAFFEHHFVPCWIAGEPAGLLTGFYEPVIAASPVETGQYRFAIYRRPTDLIDIDETDPPAGIEPGTVFARASPGGPVPYHDRRAIETGALAGRGLELAWAADRVDLFFAHVQGAARLEMADGTVRRITYAAKSGHPFSGPGKNLAAMGEIAPDEVTMQSIRAWLAKNPRRADEILWANRSFIFFRETDGGDPALGPVAAAKVQLTPGRSVALDRKLHVFGTPVFIDAPDFMLSGVSCRRLAIAQDTGSAILGAARADFFCGMGAAAGEIAGRMRHRADFVFLVPRMALARMAQ